MPVGCDGYTVKCIMSLAISQSGFKREFCVLVARNSRGAVQHTATLHANEINEGTTLEGTKSMSHMLFAFA